MRILLALALLTLTACASLRQQPITPDTIADRHREIRNIRLDRIR